MSDKDWKLSYEVVSAAKECSCSICISLDDLHIYNTGGSDITGINVAMLTTVIQGHG